MDAALRREVEAWIGDDPDPVTASQLQELLDKGDEATLIDSGDVVTITDIAWKNGEYIYYFENNDGDEVYTYESEFKF